MKKVLIVGWGQVGKMYEIPKDSKLSSSEIEKVMYFSYKEYTSRYLGAYMMEDGTKVLETVQIIDADIGTDELFKGIAYTEESIYETNIVSRIDLGYIDTIDTINTIRDLLDSINQPYTGFTLEVVGNKLNMWVCVGGVYHKNPYRKDKCIH